MQLRDLVFAEASGGRDFLHASSKVTELVCFPRDSLNLIEQRFELLLRLTRSLSSGELIQLLDECRHLVSSISVGFAVLDESVPQLLRGTPRVSGLLHLLREALKQLLRFLSGLHGLRRTGKVRKVSNEVLHPNAEWIHARRKQRREGTRDSLRLRRIQVKLITQRGSLRLSQLHVLPQAKPNVSVFTALAFIQAGRLETGGGCTNVAGENGGQHFAVPLRRQ